MHQTRGSERIKKYLSALAFLASGCSTGSNDWSEFPTHPDAEHVQVFNLRYGSAKQQHYVIEAVYPDKQVLEFYSKNIGPPWVACEFKDEWMSFEDATKNAPIFVHQSLRYWVNFETERLLMLAVRYESESGEYREIPDNTKQNVYLVENREGDISDALSRLKLVCNGA